MSDRDPLTGDVFALCSGGKDSVVTTHLVMRAVELYGYKRPVVVYLDTGTGVQAQREYVEELCDTFEWQMWVLRTHENYEDLVREHGFPGPSQHLKMYTALKERQLSKLATVSDDAHFYTGVRRSESRNRMGRVEERTEAERWTWHAPIHDWEEEEVWDYLRLHPEIPHNPDWHSGGRATDCLCGAYATPEELIGLEADHPDAARRIQQLEAAVQGKGEKSYWGWGGMNQEEQRAARAEDNPQQMTLCSSCGIPEPGEEQEYESETEP